MFPVSKCAFRPEWTFWHFPISANFSFELLLKITLCSYNFSGLYRNDIKVREPANLVVFLVETRVCVLGISPFICFVIVILVILEIEVITSVDYWLHVYIDIGHLTLTRVINRSSWTKIIELLLLLCRYTLWLCSITHVGCYPIIFGSADFPKTQCRHL